MINHKHHYTEAVKASLEPSETLLEAISVIVVQEGGVEKLKLTSTNPASYEARVAMLQEAIKALQGAKN